MAHDLVSVVTALFFFIGVSKEKDIERKVTPPPFPSPRYFNEMVRSVSAFSAATALLLPMTALDYERGGGVIQELPFPTLYQNHLHPPSALKGRIFYLAPSTFLSSVPDLVNNLWG